MFVRKEFAIHYIFLLDIFLLDISLFVVKIGVSKKQIVILPFANYWLLLA